MIGWYEDNNNNDGVRERVVQKYFVLSIFFTLLDVLFISRAGN